MYSANRSAFLSASACRGWACAGGFCDCSHGADHIASALRQILSRECPLQREKVHDPLNGEHFARFDSLLKRNTHVESKRKFQVNPSFAATLPDSGRRRISVASPDVGTRCRACTPANERRTARAVQLRCRHGGSHYTPTGVCRQP